MLLNHLFLLAVALPAFLLAPLLKMAVPIVLGVLIPLVYQYVKKGSDAFDNVVPAWAHQGINFVLQMLFAKGSMLLGVVIAPEVLTCINDAATANVLSCVDSGTVELVLRGVLAFIIGHIMHSGLKTGAAKSAARGHRSALAARY